MNTKRKFTGGSVEARTPDSRARQSPEQLQAQLPRVGLLWGVEGSAERVLDRVADASALLSAVEDRERDEGEDGTAVENALAGLLESCTGVLTRDGYVPTTTEELFDRVGEEMWWNVDVGWSIAVSAGILSQVCMKLVAARRAYRCGGRKFYELDRATGPLIPAIDRFDDALDPRVAALWLDKFAIPAEAEEADDELQSPRRSAVQKWKAAQYRCQRRKTMDRQSMPHTPPRLLCPTNGSGVMGAPKGLRGGALAGARAQRQRHDQEGLSSPSRQVENGGSYLGDMDVIMGGIDSMMLDEMPSYCTAPSFA